MHATNKKSTRSNRKVASGVPHRGKKEGKTLIAIGDIHGRSSWKEIIKKELTPDATFVFIGDYFDTWAAISAEEQVKNFEEICEFRQKNWPRVITIVGNHDFHYLEAMEERYSGYQNSAIIRNAVWKEIGKLQPMYDWYGYLFSHAGLTKTFAKKHNIQEGHEASALAHLFQDNPEAFKFYPRDISLSGSDRNQSPIWVRPDSLLADFHGTNCQVVGHTTQEHINYYKGKLPHKLILIDALGKGEYLKITDKGPETCDI